MKKILFTLVALVASMSISAQVVRLYKNGNLVASFNQNYADEIVFEEDEAASAVDLGLSVKWAECNLGAENPEDVGNYYAWGEKEPQASHTYYWSSYEWCNGSLNSLTKYCTNSSYGQVDNITQLLPADDAAQKNLPQGWRMPTQAEMKELREKCTWTWTSKNGTSGYEVKASNGNSIFLPVTGAYGAKELIGKTSQGYYWTSTLTTSDNNYAVGCRFSSSGPLEQNLQRCLGVAIRPVRDHEYVDLGLPSGLKWATCNVGANSPEQAGDFYGWGEVETKKTFSQSNYLVTEFKDVAAEKWGGSWRMPTRDDVMELINNCQVRQTISNGVIGGKITGPNGNSIFIPYAGYFMDGERVCYCELGYFWTSTLYPDAPMNAVVACNKGGDDAFIAPVPLLRYEGMNVRPVCP